MAVWVGPRRDTFTAVEVEGLLPHTDRYLGGEGTSSRSDGTRRHQASKASATCHGPGRCFDRNAFGTPVRL